MNNVPDHIKNMNPIKFFLFKLPLMMFQYWRWKRATEAFEKAERENKAFYREVTVDGGMRLFARSAGPGGKKEKG